MATAMRKWKRELGVQSCRSYLVVVVVRQALTVESHPPPLEHALPATRVGGGKYDDDECKCNPSGSLGVADSSQVSRIKA